VAKIKSAGDFRVPLEDPDLPAVIEFYAARVSQRGDHALAQSLRDRANEVRGAQAEQQAQAEEKGSGEADESGVHR
jgi:hypothetical protein